MRRKSFTLGACTVDQAANELELLDYDFHSFTAEGTGYAAVLYRAGAITWRLSSAGDHQRPARALPDAPPGGWSGSNCPDSPTCS